MSLSVSGSQFVKNGDTNTYIVSGISAGFTLDSTILPLGWTIISTGIISGGNQSFNFKAGKGSGTIIINYINGANSQMITLDVYSNATKMGEEIKQDGALLISSNNNVIFRGGASLLNIPPILCGISRCPYVMEVFADIDDPTNEYNNDKKDFYYYGDQAITTITMTLQKFTNNSWVDSISFNDSTYGDFFAYGKAPDFSGDSFKDDFGKQYTGLLLEWINVLQLRGAGLYRMKIVFTDMFSVSTTYYSQEQYALYQWNCIKPNGTVRIETFNQGLRGTLFDKTIQIDYYTGWYSQIRLRGIFLYKSSSYVKEFNQYGDADYNIYKPIINEQTPKFSLTKLYIPAWLVWYLSTNINQADTIDITDYNTSNRFNLVKIPVMNDGEITIGDNNLVDPYGDISVKLSLDFIYAQNNLRKRNSF